MRKWRLILFFCIVSFVLLFPVHSKADFILGVQPYIGGSLEAGEQFTVDLLWFNVFFADCVSQPGGCQAFTPHSWQFSVSHDLGINYYPQSSTLNDGTSWIVQEGGFIRLASLIFDTDSTISPGNYYFTITGEATGTFFSGFYGNTITEETRSINEYTYVTVSGSPSTPIPEPATMLLLGLGLVGLAGLRRKFKV
jgi:hypothetical protein